MSLFRILTVLVVLAACGANVHAQCSYDWLPGTGIPGVDGKVVGIVEWDPDGDGPMSPVIVVGGEITLAGDVPVNGVAMWDGVRWSALGNTLSGKVTALANNHGELWVATETAYDPKFVPYPAKIYKYTNEWVEFLNLTHTLNSTPTVRQILVGPDSIYISGDFQSLRSVNKTPGDYVACDGSVRYQAGVWEAIQLVAPGQQSATDLLLVDANTLAYRVGNRFFIQRPDATFPLGGTGISWALNEKAFLWKEQLFVLGWEYLTNNYGPRKTVLYRWLGTNEPDPACFERVDLPTASFPPDSIFEILPLADEFVAFRFDGCARWNGSAASDILGFRGAPTCVANTSRGIIAASDSRNIGIGGHRIASLDPSTQTWNVMGSGFNGPIRCSALVNGDLYVAGDFTRAGSISANGLARLHGANWESLGTGVAGSVKYILELDGSLFVTGSLGNAGGVPNTKYFAKWTGSEWQSIPSLATQNSPALDARRYKDSILLALGQSGSPSSLTRFRWSGMNTVIGPFMGNQSNYITSLAAFDNNNRVLVYSGPSSAFTGIVTFEYDGTNVIQSALKTPYNTGGTFTGLKSDGQSIFEFGNSRYWKGGTSWLTLPSFFPKANDVCEFNGGGVFAGKWSNYQGTSNLMYRDQSGNIAAMSAAPGGEVYSCKTLSGKVVVGGDFLKLGSVVSAYLAIYAPVDTSIQISTQPKDTQGCWSKLSQFSVAASSIKPLNFQWRRSGVPLVNGLTGTGSQIFGCTTSFLRIAPATNGKLTQYDAAVYDCVITTTCSTEITNGVRLGLAGADFNCNKLVDDADFASFSSAYNLMLCTTAGMPVGCPADLNADGVVDDADFSIFVVQYDQFLVN